MGKSLSELQLENANLPDGIVSPDDIPDEFGPRRRTIYPVKYTFQLPASMTNLWDVRDQEIDGTKVQRVEILFDEDNPLMVIAAHSPEGEEFVGTAFQTRVSSRTRPRGKNKVPVSNLYYLASAAKGEKLTWPRTNREIVNLVNSLAGRKFMALPAWSAYCNPKKGIWMPGEDGRLVEQSNEGQPVLGCGTPVYFNNWPKDQNGRYYPSVTCGGWRTIVDSGGNAEKVSCGANLRPSFPELEQYEAVK